MQAVKDMVQPGFIILITNCIPSNTLVDKTESKYHTFELETLAIVNTVKYFRHYLYGRKFLVVTEWNSLKSSRNKWEPTSHVHRW